MRTSTAPIECHTDVCRALKSNLSMIKASKISVALTTATTVGGAFYLNLNQSFQLGNLGGTSILGEARNVDGGTFRLA